MKRSDILNIYGGKWILNRYGSLKAALMANYPDEDWSNVSIELENYTIISFISGELEFKKALETVKSEQVSGLFFF